MSETAIPLCPITGRPARRRIQTVSSRVLAFIWRVSFRIGVAHQLVGVERLELWESPCGLAFFAPMVAGDKSFYDDLYVRLGEEGPWQGAPVERSDYRRVAAEIGPGDKVLDVGCGSAGFARWVPAARYVGLERSIDARKVPAEVRGDTIAEHAAGHPGEYDAVCSFHVIEHVAEPARFAAEMVRCLKPGGRIFLAAPGWPGAMTDIPNFALNAPPHHLSWWSEQALQTLAETLGLIPEAIETLDPSPHLAILYWMARAAPRLTGERYFRHAWGWYAGLVWSWLAGRLCNALFGPPRAARSFELLLVARKPL